MQITWIKFLIYIAKPGFCFSQTMFFKCCQPNGMNIKFICSHHIFPPASMIEINQLSDASIIYSTSVVYIILKWEWWSSNHAGCMSIFETFGVWLVLNGSFNWDLKRCQMFKLNIKYMTLMPSQHQILHRVLLYIIIIIF